jgi:hypothetical protein
MSQSQSSVTAQDEIASTYERNGFVESLSGPTFALV